MAGTALGGLQPLFRPEHVRIWAAKGTVDAYQGGAPPSALSIEELDLLFDAVRARLRISADMGLSATAEECTPTAIHCAFSTMLECVDALDRWQALLALQRSAREASVRP
jgi:hypothetical protein